MSEKSIAPKASQKSGLPKPLSGLNTPIRGSRESLTGSADDWIIGDRCWVGGTKAGKVAFLGETRFAQGEWAGVALDETEGKNDGSVGGVRYFQCPANRGIFCRINKLVRKPAEQHVANQAAAALAKRQPALEIETSENSPVSNESPSVGIADEVGGDETTSLSSDLNVGDRVVVNGNKNGALRFLGTTEFAQGVWVGVELDQPIGKNDGSVQGKRYFTCKPRYGLFAPLAKTEKVQSPAAKRLAPVRHTITSNLRLQKSLSRAGSQESLSSLNSVQSSASRRVRLGVAALTASSQLTQQPASSARSGSIGPAASSVVSPTIAAYQESLKEKEQHVDQLLRERDIERSEMAKLSQLLEEARQDLLEAKDESNRSLSDIRLQKEHIHSMLEQSEKENRKLKETLEEEKRRIEDLQFRIEEESISKMDLESKFLEMQKSSQLTAVDKECHQNEDLKVTQLHNSLETEKANSHLLFEKLEKSELECRQLATEAKTTASLIVELRSTITDKEAKFLQQEDKRTTEYEKLLSLVREKSNDYDMLKNEFDLVHIQLAELQKKASQSIEQLDIEAANKESKVNKLENEIESLKTKLESQGLELEKTSALASSCKLAADAAQQTLKECTLEKNFFSDKILQLQNTAQEYQDQKLCLEKETRSLKEELLIAERALNSAQKEVEMFKATAHNFEQSREDLQKLNADMFSQISSLTEKESRLHNELKAIVVEKELTSSAILSTQLELVSRIKECEYLQNSKAELETRVADMLSQISNAQMQMDSYATINKTLQSEVADVRRQLATAEQDISKLKADNLAAVNEKASLQAMLTQNLEETTNALITDKQQLQNQLAQSNNEKDALFERIERLQLEKASLNGQLADLLSKFGEAENQAQNYAESNKSLQSTLSETNAALEIARDAFSKQADYLSASNEKVSAQTLLTRNLEEMNNTLINDKLQLQNQLEQSNNENQMLNDQCKKILAEHSALDAQLPDLLAKITILESEVKISKDLCNGLQTQLTETKERAVKLEAEKLAAFNEKSSLEFLHQQTFDETTKRLLSSNHQLEADLLSFKTKSESLEEKLKSILDEKCRLSETINLMQSMAQINSETSIRLESENVEFQRQLQSVQQECSTLNVEKSELASKCAAVQALLDQIVQQTAKVTTGEQLKNDEIELLKSELSTSRESLSKRSQEWQNVQSQFDLLEIHCNKLELEKSDALQQLSDKSKALEETLAQFICISNETEQNKIAFESCKAAKESLVAEVGVMKHRNNQLEDDLKALKSTLAITNDAGGLREENVRLKDRVKELESQANSNSTSVTYSETSAGSALGDSNQELQVQFLNSVIADLVGKNKELQMKNDIFMQGGVDTLGLVSSLPKVLPPRLYCDICEAFDLHDTEDCPTQAGEDEPATHSHFSGTRNTVRPFCEKCENFGHMTEECDQETF